MLIRYLLALILAGLIIGGGAAFVHTTHHRQNEFMDQFKQKLKAQKKAGRLPAELKDEDIDKLTIEDMGVPLPSEEMVRWDLAAWIAEFWYLLGPFVVLNCLAMVSVSRLIWKPRKKQDG